MHIGFVLIPYQWYSGAGKYCHNLYSELIKIDKVNKYTVFLPSDAPERAIDYFGASNSVRTSIPTNPGLLRYFRTMFTTYFESYTPRIDLLQCFNFAIPVFKRKVTLTVHDVRELDLPETYGSAHRFLLRFFRNSALKRADHIMTVSEFSMSRIISYYPFCSQKISLSCNGINASHFNVNKTGNSPHARPYILTVGHLAKHKNHLNLIRAFNILCRDPNFRHDLIIVGKNYGSSGIVDKLKSAVERRQRVVFTDQVDDTLLAAYYTHADLFVFPSLYEGFGIPLLEAFACNVPVAASRIPVFQEVYGFPEAMFDPLSPPHIASVVGALIENRELRSASVGIGSQKLRQYTWKATAESTLKVYGQLLDSRRQP